MKNDEGVYEFACIEGTRPWFCDIIPSEGLIHTKFASATVPNGAIRFRSACGKFDLVFAVRREFPEWFLPQSTDVQRNRSIKFWNQEYIAS